MLRRMVPRAPAPLVWFALLMLPWAHARASEEPPGLTEGVVLVPVAVPSPTVSFRVGAAPGAVGALPYMCLEVAVGGGLSLEGCGTGAGFLGPAAGLDVAHFRGKIEIGGVHTALGWLVPVLHAGFAELEIGEDEPGFDFGGAGALGTETAGPEAGAALKLVRPLDGGAELIIELNVNLMWFPGAGELLVPQPALQPEATLTVGVGW